MIISPNEIRDNEHICDSDSPCLILGVLCDWWWVGSGQGISVIEISLLFNEMNETWTWRYKYRMYHMMPCLILSQIQVGRCSKLIGIL